MHRPPPADAVRFYDEVADTYADALPTTEAELPVDLAVLEHFLALLPPRAHVLDAGCGAGRLFPLLARHGRAVEGVDISAAMIRRCRRDHSDVPARVADLAALPYRDGCFDGVVSWYSTIHADAATLRDIVAEARRILRTGGHALLAFQTGEGPRVVGEAFQRVGHDVSIVRYHRRPEAIAHVLRAHGLDVVTRLERAPAASEPDGQAILIARAV